MIILGGALGLDLGRGDWLAFNPALANALGWKLSPEGLFRWLDANNDVMVESFYWKDGPLERQPKQEDICGEGWLVFATTKAVVQIKYAGLEGVKVNVVVRSYKEEQTDEESSTFIETREKW